MFIIKSPGRNRIPCGFLGPAFLMTILAAVGSGAAAGATEPAVRPNIVYILADDLGWADVGWHGGEIKTPHFDKLAASGARLEQFYVQPVCSPTRAALLTGRRADIGTSLWRHY